MFFRTSSRSSGAPGGIRTAARTLRAHRLRFAIPALAVFLGVAFVTGSLIYSHSVSVGTARAAANSQPDASVRVEPDDRVASGRSAPAPRLDGALLRRLRAVPGAAGARGTAEGNSFVVGSNGALVGNLDQSAGVNYAADASGKDPRYPLVSGRAPHGPREIALDRQTARRTGLRAGSHTRVVVNGKVRRTRVVGVLTAHDSRLYQGGTLTAFDTATAQRQFAPAPGTYTALTLTAAEGTSQAQLAHAAAKVLPRGLRAVAASDEISDFIAHDNEKTTELLLSFAGVALFVSTFLIANTFTMLSAARAREHALLRAIGATRGYVLRQVLTEAAMVGAAAAVTGYVGGIGVAELLNNSFSVTGNHSAPLQLFSPTPVLAALAVGLGVTVVSAYVPARRASAVSPIAALRTSEPPKAASLRRRHAIGLGVTALGALLAAAAVSEQNLLFVAAPFLLLGLIILTPLLSLGLTRLIRSPMARWAGIRGTLAVENARRNPRRTAATAATLMIGLTVVTAVTVVIASVNRMDELDAASSMTSDLRVTAVDFAQLPDDAASRIERIPGVRDASPVTSTALQLSHGRTLPATGVRPGAVEHLVPLTVREGSLSHLGRGIAVTRKTAARYGWKLGTRVSGTFTGTTKRTALPIVALYDGPDEFTPALLPSSLLPRSTGDPESPQMQSVLVNGQAGHVAALKERIRHTLDNPVLRVEDRADAQAAASASTELFLNIVYAMLSVSVLIGALGVVNTMGMAVSERLREIGLLRALGLDRRRLASVLRLESMTIALLGSALGVIAGGVLGAAAVLSQKGVPLLMPWDRLALCFVAAAAIGVLASVWPGRQAARIPMLKAIGTDTE